MDAFSRAVESRCRQKRFRERRERSGRLVMCPSAEGVGWVIFGGVKVAVPMPFWENIGELAWLCRQS